MEALSRISASNINDINSFVWDERMDDTYRFVTKNHLLRRIIKREVAKAQFVGLATTEEERTHRLGSQKSFEWEREDIEKEFSDTQRERAQKPRGEITEDGKRPEEFFAGFLSNEPFRGEQTKRLWLELGDFLHWVGLNPEEHNTSEDVRKWTYHYTDMKGRRRKISFGHFANIVSAIRNRKSD